jgi:hypothetical protein
MKRLMLMRTHRVAHTRHPTLERKRALDSRPSGSRPRPWTEATAVDAAHRQSVNPCLGMDRSLALRSCPYVAGNQPGRGEVIISDPP